MANKEILTTFDPEMQELCSSFMQEATKQKKRAMDLFDKLVSKQIVDFDIHYETFTGNTLLMRTITKYIGQGLSQDIKNSINKSKIVTDHDVYFNLNNDSKINARLIEMQLTQHSDALKFKAAFRLVHKNIMKARWDLLYFMELPGGPDEDKPKTPGIHFFLPYLLHSCHFFLPAPKKTVEAIAKELGDCENILAKKRKSGTTHSSMSNESDKDDENYDQEETLSDIATNVTNYEKGTKQTKSKLVSDVLKTFPTIETGVFTIIDESDGKLYIGSDEFNKECADMYRGNSNFRVLHKNN